MNRKPLLTTLTFFVFAMGGAYLLFHVLDSSAELTWRGYALGGALAGFVVQFLLMKWAYSRLCDPPLSVSQTMVLIQLVKEAHVSRILMDAARLIGQLDEGIPMPDDDEIVQRVKAILADNRSRLRGFKYPVPSLEAIVKRFGEDRPEFDEAIRATLPGLRDTSISASIRLERLRDSMNTFADLSLPDIARELTRLTKTELAGDGATS